METKDFADELERGITYILGTDMFKDVFGTEEAVKKTCCTHGLLVDTAPTDDGYELKAEVPGIGDDGIDIKYEKNIVTITADYGEEGNGLRKGPFTFRGRLEDVDSTKIEAKLKDGILTINLPKREETRAKKINITT